MLSLIPAMPPCLTPSGEELRVSLPLGVQSRLWRRGIEAEPLAIRELRRVDGSTQSFSYRSLVEVEAIVEFSDGTGGVQLADGFCGPFEKSPNVKLRERCCLAILGAHHSLIREFVPFQTVKVVTERPLPQSPLIVFGGIVHECCCTRVKCELKLDVLGQLPDFTAAVRWHHNLLQRGEVMNRRWRQKLPDVVPMEPPGSKSFFSDVFPKAFSTCVHTGMWLPARIGNGNDETNEDVVLQLRQVTGDGTGEVDVWTRDKSFKVKAGTKLWRVQEWEEHQEWDEQGEAIDDAQPARSTWCIGEIIPD